MFRLWYLVTAFFSTRGSWHGYVFRVGIIWLGGLMCVWHMLTYEGIPLTPRHILLEITQRVVLGAIAGSVSYGVMRPAETFRKSVLAERAASASSRC
jgi:hypothetical protein